MQEFDHELFGRVQAMKKVKRDEPDTNAGFYIFKTKIIKFTELQDNAGLNIILTDIAESISKPAHINEYEITKPSLLRAKALGYTWERVIDFLSDNTRNPPIHRELISMIKQVM